MSDGGGGDDVTVAVAVPEDGSEEQALQQELAEPAELDAEAVAAAPVAAEHQSLL
jgi:hypothetical protein